MFDLRTKFIIAFLLALGVNNLVHACACGSSHFIGINNYGSTVLTIPADTLPRGKFAIGYALNYQDYDAFNARKFADLNRRDVHSHSIDSAMTQSLTFAYGLTDDLSLIIVAPFRSINDQLSTDEGITVNDGNSTGIGDISLLAKYRFFEGRSISAAALAGIKIPSGNTSQRNEFGFLLAADSQPGSGSWDPIFGLALTKKFEHSSISSNVLYTLSTPGTQDTVVGDNIGFNLSYSKHLYHGKIFNKKIVPTEFLGQQLDWDLVTEMNGSWNEKVETNGVKDDNHGGLIISLTPGIRLTINERISNSFYVGIPVVQNLNGVQSDLNYQIGFNTSVSF